MKGSEDPRRRAVSRFCCACAGAGNDVGQPRLGGDRLGAGQSPGPLAVLRVPRLAVRHTPGAADRADPAAGKIPIAFYVHPRTDSSSPAREPIFVSPGGPGDSGWGVRFFYAGTALDEQHDIVIVDSRGSGRSGLINCRDLQNGWRNRTELIRGNTACARQLGREADRYGSGDIAMDVEAVRQALGYDAIDYYAFSYGTVPEQAYLARYPQRVHAMALDSGMPVTDPAHVWAWSLGVTHALVRIGALSCRRQHCGTNIPRAIAWLAARVRVHPVVGKAANGRRIVVDEAELLEILRSGGDQDRALPADAIETLVGDLRRGNTASLIRLAVENPVWGQAGPPQEFSQGANSATYCNDADFVWERSDPVAVRERKYRSAVSSLPKSTFAPFSIAGWNAHNSTDECGTWPAPERFEPATPSGIFPRVPTIVFSGDEDPRVPTEITRKLLDVLPGATFVEVAGAAHPAIGWRRDCVPDIAARFFDTLKPGNTSCARRVP